MKNPQPKQLKTTILNGYQSRATWITILHSKHSQELHASSRPDQRIARLGLGCRWPPNGRQFSQLLHLPQGGIYRCQRSPATRAAASPQRLRQWKDGRWLKDGIALSDGLGFSYFFVLSVFHSLILVLISMHLFLL